MSGERTTSDAKLAYYSITNMSSAFRIWEDKQKNHAISDDDYRMWSLRFQLAQAQQQSMVAAHLAKIVAIGQPQEGIPGKQKE